MKRDKRLLHIFMLLVVSAVAWRFGIKFGALALAVTLLGLRASAKWQEGDDGTFRSSNEHILYQKFGRWTRIVQYGPLALFAVVSVAARETRDPVLARLSWIAMGVFFAVGLYLCWVIAAAKHGWNRSDGDERKEE